MSNLQGTLVKTPDGMTDAFDIAAGGINRAGGSIQSLGSPQKNAARKRVFPAWSSVFSYP
ncbi:hypothetical protein [Paenibacillus elgii]|uniref:hypothetical protein n=1 Tax=Paenibacillus elgii TaxID=189691 RepID=UPI0011B1CF97|nr:hypothetical protein [Paenibacillus elgii]